MGQCKCADAKKGQILNMIKLSKFASAAASLMTVALLLTSCGSGAAPSTGGAGAIPDVLPGVSTGDGTTAPIPEESGGVGNTQTPTGRASYTGSAEAGDLVYTTYDGRVIDDFSFLDGLNRNFFSDVDSASDPTGSWFCGRTERDPATGESRIVWDRASDVLEAIDRYGAIYRKNTDKKVLYLTFDCGYENGYTGTILDILKEKDVPAAFFLNGHFISSSSDLVKRMLDEGHIVGNHGNNHKVMAKLSIDEFMYEVESMNELMEEYVPGSPYMRYFRPSYGSCSEWDMALIHKMGLTETLYSWTYYDYDPDNQSDPAVALELAKAGLHDGSVIMLHTVGETNTKMLGDFIDYARAEGYTFLSLDE